jgi:hypothetical protein
MPTLKQILGSPAMLFELTKATQYSIAEASALLIRSGNTAEGLQKMQHKDYGILAEQIYYENGTKKNYVSGLSDWLRHAMLLGVLAREIYKTGLYKTKNGAIDAAYKVIEVYEGANFNKDKATVENADNRNKSFTSTGKLYRPNNWPVEQFFEHADSRRDELNNIRSKKLVQTWDLGNISEADMRIKIIEETVQNGFRSLKLDVTENVATITFQKFTPKFAKAITESVYNWKNAVSKLNAPTLLVPSTLIAVIKNGKTKIKLV